MNSRKLLNKQYPDPNHPFHIHPDASDYQLGSVIKQHGHPVAYYSRKLTKTQQNYTTIEKELLSIVETLRTFRSFLLGAKINIYTDHKNLTFNVDNANSRVLRWRLLVEDFQPTFYHVPGPENVEADGLSRLPILAPLVGQEDLADESDLFLYESMLMYPDPDPNDPVFPLDYNIIQEGQNNDQDLQQQLASHPDVYQQTIFNGINLICHMPQRNNTWKICIPTTLLPNIVRWYHTVLGHVGIQRLYQTISVHFHAPKLRDTIDEFVKSCDACQRFKLPGIQVGELPPKNLTAQPWDEVSVDLIGPWKISIHGVEYEFLALTAVDPATTLAEIIRIENKTSAHVAMKFENEWLSRYPRPLRCVHDQGPEFMSLPFQHVLAVNGIKDVPTTVANPQANAVNERLHQTIENTLRTMLHTFNPQNQVEAANLVDNCLATAQYAVRSAVHRVLNVSPGAMVFQRDMVLPIPLIANFELIRQRRQAMVDENNRRQNLRRRFYDYNVGDEVLIVDRNKNRPTLAPISIGPFVVQQSHVNGTVTILRAPNVYERINIRRLRPYHRHGE
jgi:transposase InsO family protein